MEEKKKCFSLRLSEEENQKLKKCAALCGLSQSEFLRQLCTGKQPKPKPGNEFWLLLESLYDLHDQFKACIPFAPEAQKECQGIEDLILRLQGGM